MDRLAILGVLIFGLVHVIDVPAAEVVIKAESAAIRTEGGPSPGGGWNLWSNGRVGQPLRFATEGTYSIVVQAWGSPAAEVWPEMGFMIDGRVAKTVTVDRDEPADYRFETQLAAGIHEIAAAFLNDAVVGRDEHGIRMKGHPLLWGNQAGIPRWSEGQPSPEIQRQRVVDIMQRNNGRIEFWEVVNEPSHLAEPKIDEPYRWAREADPGAYLIVNDYYVLADGCPKFLKLVTQAKQNAVSFDGIGIQAHEPRTMRFPLDRVQEILDRYASLGKELHITEFTPASSGKRISGSHREGVWDEAAQAEYAVKFYRVCFAHPSMRAITWWDLCDQGSWLPGGGMLRADMSPKPVYEQLKQLIHEEWKTGVTTTTDDDGEFSFRGFFGEYRVTIELPDGKVERQFRVRKGQPNHIVVALTGNKEKRI